MSAPGNFVTALPLPSVTLKATTGWPLAGTVTLVTVI